MGKRCIYPGTHLSPGVSHFADEPPGSAHHHPNKENKSKEKEYGRQSGRVVTLYIVLQQLDLDYKNFL